MLPSGTLESNKRVYMAAAHRSPLCKLTAFPGKPWVCTSLPIMALASSSLRSNSICAPRAARPAANCSSRQVQRAQRLVTRAGQAVDAAEVTTATFDAEVLKSNVPVMVDFWAPWCGPCKMIAPIVDEIARDYSGTAKAVKINTDASPEIATEYGVRSIPTVMIFKKGSRVETIIGAVNKATLVQALEKYL